MNCYFLRKKWLQVKSRSRTSSKNELQHPMKQYERKILVFKKKDVINQYDQSINQLDLILFGPPLPSDFTVAADSPSEEASRDLVKESERSA